MAAPIFRGVDPASRRSGTQAFADLESAIGRKLSDDERGWTGYGDASGKTDVYGGQYNSWLQEAQRRTPGSTFEAWSAPQSSQGPVVDVPDAPGFTAPRLSMPAAPGAPKPYDPFKPPTESDVYGDPGFRTGLTHGVKAMDMSAAAKGNLRTGGHLADLVRFGNDYALQKYGDVYNRSRDTWNANRDLYGMTEQDRIAAYERQLDQAGRQYDADFSGAAAEYAPRLATWQTRTAANIDAARMGFDRDWQREIYGRDDARMREFYDRDDLWRRYASDEDRRRFLAELGAR